MRRLAPALVNDGMGGVASPCVAADYPWSCAPRTVMITERACRTAATDMAGDIDPVWRECVVMFGNPKDVCSRTEVVVSARDTVRRAAAGVSAGTRVGRSAAVTVLLRPQCGARGVLCGSSARSVVNPRQEGVGRVGRSVGHVCTT
jgi:hypothetical protein